MGILCNKYNFSSIIFLVLVFSLIETSIQMTTLEISYPNSLTLQDNSIVFLESKGIYFYDKDFTTAEKSFLFDEVLTSVPVVLMKEFSNDNGGYIVILVEKTVEGLKKKFLYVFSSEKTIIKFGLEVRDNNINQSNIFDLIPYKLNGNYLYFILPYIFNSKINLSICKIDLVNELDLDLEVKEIPIYNTDGSEFAGNYKVIKCLYMSPIESYTYELLTCFTYLSQYPDYIHSFTLDPNNNFTEIESLRSYLTYLDVSLNFLVLNVQTNKNKNKVLLYTILAYYPYWITFDYTNRFSSFVRESVGNHPQLGAEEIKHQIFYFTQTEEFVLISNFGGEEACNKFVMVFHDNCTLNYLGVLYITEGCSYSQSLTIFYSNNKYTVLGDGGNINGHSVSFYQSSDELVQDIPYGLPITTTYIENPTTIFTTVPTTIITTYIEIPTTIITTFIEVPTTILTTFIEVPTTILTTFIEVPTTILTTFIEVPTTILTTFIEAPTTILTTFIEAPTTILTTFIEVPTTILTTFIEAPTTILTTFIETPTTIITTLIETPTTIITTLIETPTTIITTIIQINENILEDKKCKTSTDESAHYNLCITCNIDEQYYPALFPENDFLHGFTECYNSTTKPINFYLDSSDNKYKPCYETCLTCNKGGNSENNNCLTCEINYIKKPDYPNSTNCVTECYYSYYYSAFGQYKCTNNSICPDEAHLYIKDLKKCTNDCKKESEYRYQYGGKCLIECPQETSPNDNNICLDNNTNSCSMSDSEIDLQQFLASEGVDINAKNYAKEFAYTTKHISHYYNSMYSILLYKDINCIDELKVTMPKVDFGNCYNKVQDNLEPPTEDNIIIAIIERENGQKKSTISYNFYHPVTGDKIDADTICKDEEIVIKESVMSQLNNTDVNLDSILYLTQQDINIFNLSDDFYTDICYHFDSPNGKDVPLQDRIKTYYPNITLCDSGCTSKGVNLTSMESICECKFNDLMNNELIEGNALIQNTLGGVTLFCMICQ